jgi:hypothetical protein
MLRTFVSWGWGIGITWLLTVAPIFEPFREDLLALSDWALLITVALISAGWYTLWRWLEPRLPKALTAAVLGSSKQPVYVTKEVAAATSNPLDRVPGADHLA